MHKSLYTQEELNLRQKAYFAAGRCMPSQGLRYMRWLLETAKYDDEKDFLISTMTKIYSVYCQPLEKDDFDEVRIFHKVIVAVSKGDAFLVCSSDGSLEQLMVGSMFEDNSAWDTLPSFPKEPGVYSMTIRYEFTQGYQGSKSVWDFIPTNIKKLSLAGQG